MNNFNKIHIYNRHYSRNKKHPMRPQWFDYEKTFGNLLDTINFDFADLTVIFEKEEDYPNYFIKKYEGVKPFKVKFIDTSEEAWKNKPLSEPLGWCRSIAAAAEVIKNDNLPENDLVMISDDDFIYTPKWVEVCLDYANNFLKGENWWINPCDYGDRYLFVDDQHRKDQYGTDWGMYAELESKIRISNNRWWRETKNSLTSAIIPVRTWNRDYEDYWRIGTSDCSMCGQTREKYGTQFWSPIPSLSCHALEWFNPPFIEWQNIMEQIRIKL